jgi:L,D-peptidoglycan transpeptidase YkuD (ErfK/YbiS/YcfS/YnhG family)
VLVRPLVAVLGVLLVAGCTSGRDDRPVSSPASTPTLTATSAPATRAATGVASSSATRTRPTQRPTTTHPSVDGASLPLGYATGSARQVITVVAGAESDTQATVQAWRRVARGWLRVGPSVPAWLGADGMTQHPSEQLSAVPMGSYSLTDAFGRDPDPGTALHYVQTDPSYWWISQPGPLYNTMQRCSSGCAFTQGAPNEHLYYEIPHYNYAVVIDYNRDPVQQGAGSAFFLHVSVGAPTAGCVSIDQGQLVRIMRWLDPRDHPRILIGTG